jgi:hypothetical protein
MLVLECPSPKLGVDFSLGHEADRKSWRQNDRKIA